ncbi:MAG: VIT domain-containing protein [Phycisphaerae bacterium]|nr:VIT domain-containing protein [Phycisphaerae bacterium]
MRCLLVLAVLGFYAVDLSAQPAAAPPAGPRLVVQVEQKKRTLALEKLDVRVLIDGFAARTALTMTFANELDQQLDGELIFPLPAGATIRGYGLDVEGEVVDAVAVEKQRARVSYETEIRKGVDPGLVEHVVGNHFRTRIWPIPPSGRRTIRVEYVSDLSLAGGAARYRLPMSFGPLRGPLSLLVEVAGGPVKPQVTAGGPAGLAFDRAGERFVGEAKVDAPGALADLVIEMPQAARSLVRVEASGKDHLFSIDDFPRVPADRPRAKPTRIGLFWDASLSRANAKRDAELALIRDLVRRLGSVSIDVVVFRETMDERKNLDLRDGNAEPLIEHLQRVTYDGATNLGELILPASNVGFYSRQFLAITRMRSLSYDYHLLFTDGIATLGQDLPRSRHRSQGNPPPLSGRLFPVPVYTISASAGADAGLLGRIAGGSGGAHLNLQALTGPQASAAVGRPPLALVRAEYDAKEIGDLVLADTSVSGRFGFGGRLLAPEAQIALHYGFGNDVIHTSRFTVRRADVADHRELVSQRWARMQVQKLSVFADRHRGRLVELGLRFGLVTPHTSLIVLESLEQHLAYRIAPAPSRTEMFKAYMEAIGRQLAEAKKDDAQRLEQVVAAWQQRVKWWETDFRGAQKRATQRVAATNRLVDQTAALAVRYAAANGQERVRLRGELEALTDRLQRQAGEGRVTEEQVRRLGQSLNNVELAKIGEEGFLRRLSLDLAGEAPAGGGLFSDGTTDAAPAPAEATVASSPAAPSGAGGALFGAAANDEDAEGEGQSREAGRAIAIAPWNPDTPYLKAIKKAGREVDYTAYLQQRRKFGAAPAFYFDVAEHFFRTDRKPTAIRVLTGVLELDLQSPQLVRIVAHRLKQAGEIKLALDLFEQVRDWRPEEPQSHRDLALVLANRAEQRAAEQRYSEAFTDYLQAIELLNQVVIGSWDGRFEGIEVLALMDINRLIARADRVPGKRDWAPSVDPRLLKLLDCDVRIELTWDTDMTDIDLWVVEPTGEKCLYSHNRTAIGGLMSNDMTGGYGPEEYVIRRAYPGTYRIMANYFGSSSQKATGPTTLQLDLVTDFGRDTEKRKSITLRLTDAKDVVEVGSVQLGQAVKDKLGN